MKHASPEEFERAPGSAFVTGPTWVYGATDDGLRFTLLHGHGAESDGHTLMRLWATELTAAPHDSLCDARELLGTSPGAFQLVTEFVVREQSRIARAIGRMALVRPGGLVGTLVQGFYGVFPAPECHRVFATRGEALAWLGRTADALGEVDRALRLDPTLARVRQLLADADADLPRVARAVALSSRSLQRRLGELGTAFSLEVRRARIERAKRLLVTTDEKLATVAARVGFSSASTFAEAFARDVGEPPSAWRARRRAERSR